MKVVETIHGTRSKYEIVKEEGGLGSTKFHIYKDGKYWKGSYSKLSSAVEAVENRDK